jgi:hypothetical protein
MRAALTVVLVAGALAALLLREDPTIFDAARLFPVASPPPTATATLAPAPADILRQRPLRLPSLAPGGQCPWAPGRAVDPALGEVVGEGPIYVALGVEATLEYAPAQNFGSQAWGGQKTIWAVPPGFVGLVLVRGRQVDGPNEVRFGRGDVPAADLLFSAPGEAQSDPPNSWTYEVDYTRVQTPGCYAYQIDGETFSEVVVFRAKPNAT